MEQAPGEQPHHGAWCQPCCSRRTQLCCSGTLASFVTEKEIVSQCIAKQTLQNRTQHKAAGKCAGKVWGEALGETGKYKHREVEGQGEMEHQMDGFSFEPSVMPEADTIATAQTLQYVISALSNDADSIISGSLGGHIPLLFFSTLLFFTIPASEAVNIQLRPSQLRVGG